MTALPSSMETAGQPTFRQLRQLRHLSGSTWHIPFWNLSRLMSRQGLRVTMAGCSPRSSAATARSTVSFIAVRSCGSTVSTGAKPMAVKIFSTLSMGASSPSRV